MCDYFESINPYVISFYPRDKAQITAGTSMRLMGKRGSLGHLGGRRAGISRAWGQGHRVPLSPLSPLLQNNGQSKHPKHATLS